MKAIIMAGGEGTRLRPITSVMPKPAVPVCDKPVIIHIIQLLEKHGISKVAVTLKYLPSEIKKLVEAAIVDGMIKADVCFCTETVPLGTAGSVKNCIKECYDGSREDYLIISGDAITDIDLSDMMNFHKEKSNLVTIAVKEVEEPTEFGVVLTNSQNMVTGFIEKPTESESVSNLANTGIYIVTPELMDLCPDERACDFAKDIFSKIQDLSHNVAAYTTDSFWCDIGNIDSYKKVNIDMALKDIQITGSDSFIGNNCEISNEVQIINSVICHGCTIESGSIIENSVVMCNAKIGRNCRVSDSVICRNSTLKDAIRAKKAVIGENVTVGNSVTIRSGSKIWENCNILPESIICGTVRVNDRYSSNVVGNFASVGSYTPEMVLRIGRAFGTFCGQNASVLVCHDGSGSSGMIAAGFQASLASVGIAVKTIESTPLPVVRWICRSGICDGAVHITENQDNHVHLLNGFGDDLCKNERRKLKSIYDIEDFVTVNRYSIPVFEELSNPEDYYISTLMDIFKCPHKNLNYIGKKYTKSQRCAAVAYLTVKMFRDAPVFLPSFDSLAAEKIAAKYDRYVIKCGCNTGDIMAEMEKFMHIDGVYAQYLMLFDDLAFDLAMCCIEMFINEENDIETQTLLSAPIFRSEWEIPVKKGTPKVNKAEIIKKFTNSEIAKNGYEIVDGIRLHGSDFTARVCAEDKKQAFHVYVESLSEELGKEVAYDILKTLENLLT